MIQPQDFGPYEEVYKIIQQFPDPQSGLDYDTVKSKLQTTPGLFFSPGTTWSEVFSRMTSWGWLESREGRLYPNGDL